MMWETASYVVTVIGLPLAIAFYVLDRFKQRSQEEEETYLHLTDEYVSFLKLALDNADLRLLDPNATHGLDDEQKMRKFALLGILISLFERAYILTYRDAMRGAELRRWRSWEDWMVEWCRREDFRAAMDVHLPGEDPEFVAYLQKLAAMSVPGSRQKV
ncbi:hypothetical protein VE26_09930 [Devosia chinhatensis]|uniref:DUF4760 domain-containing protein n=2 Tax=Devosia chinhatensis TaxID=429727 RepID=A0A0F5FMM3_9HYPH|nr:hypothetical protein VE26_09930 [Devosia chinhatensis]